MQKSAIDNNKIYNNKLDKNNTISIAGRLYERDELFDLCWKAYPRKEGKAVAKRAWVKLKEEDILLIQQHLPLFKKESSAKEKRFIPHFSTYLNQRRFEDEVTPTKMDEFKAKMDVVAKQFEHLQRNRLESPNNQ